VKFFYENVFVCGSSAPAQQAMITAIHLLFLLSSNRTEEFYSKLEAITAEQLRDTLLSYVLLLNDAIEEGNYRKVFSLRLQNPLPEYFGPFLDTILETVRTEIARSAEKAYAELSLKEALSIFQFESVQQLRVFAEAYQEAQEDHSTTWVFKEDRVVFEKETNKRTSFNSEDLIRKVLEYSQELERIA
jgi:26S proteasome regulatory subunit N12